MLILEAPSFKVELWDEVGAFSSPDSVRHFDREYFLGEDPQHRVVSRHGVRTVRDDATPVASVILMANGGATGVHQHSALLAGDRLLVAVCGRVCALSVPDLELTWNTEVDWGTCFGVHRVPGSTDIISHGELQISRVSEDGVIKWSAGGRDIFSEPIAVDAQVVRATDFDGHTYCFDIRTGLLTEGRESP